MKIFFFVLLFFLLIIGGTKYAQAATISISSQSFTISSGHYKTLYVNGTNNKVTWSTSNNAVAAVSSYGRVTAKAPGTATICASVSGKKLYCKVTVIKLTAASVTLKSGTTKTLKVYGTSSKVTWTSSDNTIAAVSYDGKVTAKKPGTATIYAYVSGKKLSSKVTVIKLNASSTTLAVGAAKTLKVYGTSSSVIWSSSDNTVAMVASDGKVSAKKAGTATITAAVAEVKLSCKVTVNNPEGAIAQETVSTFSTLEEMISSQEHISSSSTKMIGYYAAWSKYSGFTPDKIDAMKLTHINYAFANIGSNLKITLGYPDIDPYNISKLNQLKQINPNLKTIISVGGWSWSGKFSDVALTEESRSVFADSCANLL